jgi:hypothetical protein
MMILVAPYMYINIEYVHVTISSFKSLSYRYGVLLVFALPKRGATCTACTRFASMSIATAYGVLLD